MIKTTLIVVTVGLFVLASAARGARGAVPPGEAGAKAALEKSPRHGEYVDVPRGEGKSPLRAYVVYPESKDKAPVVIVIHEIFGLTDWIKSVADQLAADGFIAVAPDFLTGHGTGGGGTDTFGSRDDVVKAVRALGADEVNAGLDAAREYGAKLAASNGKTATIGFCWGGARSFGYAAHQPQLNAAVVYYGTSPEAPELARVAAPVLGLYGSDDARVNQTIPRAEQALKGGNKTFEHHIYEGAGHGFLRQQDGRNGANQKATEQAWPRTVEFLRQHTK